MKILFISDSHTFHNDLKDLPEADAICCSGDICMRGDFQEALDFLAWFSALDYKYKIFTVGNHDICFDNNHPRCSGFRITHQHETGEYIEDIRNKIPDNVIFLEGNEVVIEGFKFWGTPETPWFHNWAFNVARGPQLEEIWSKMPEDVDVLLTHGPPHKVLDTTMEGLRVGCEDLTERLKTVKPKVHSFGHIHEEYGHLEQDGVLYLNSSVVNRRYWTTNKPHLVEVTKEGATMLEW